MMLNAREEVNRLEKEGRIESKHSIMSLEGTRSRSHDFEAKLRKHSLTFDCDTF